MLPDDEKIEDIRTDDMGHIIMPFQQPVDKTDVERLSRAIMQNPNETDLSPNVPPVRRRVLG